MTTLTPEPKKDNRGGARPGAGRPKGSTDKITIAGLLSSLENRGLNYTETLVEDFAQARLAGDSALTLKYHNLILNKVMATLNEVVVDESDTVVNNKALAFAEALAALTKLNTENTDATD
ncbi:hypothetical protein UFOVP180_51 [uncultured Caudovirales phage]|uniref:Uncharacterized protein n=1 Tax=uncultured Caudovirales phage TaxID=2100421 RepID=A0A6J7WCR2_9CAUD|nr:hypothetical protein UFOVP180_51 [uncultured Caudovirales phage]